MNNGKIDVLEAGCSYDGGLIKRARLHRIAIVEDDFPAGDFEGFDLLLGGLTTCHPAGNWLSGVGEAREGG